MNATTWDVVVVGGGPAGATAAHDLARAGRSVVLLDRAGRIKPCGGAIPPVLIKEFDIPDHLLVARIRSARMISPTDRRVDMPISDSGFVGMVDREHFDEWLRERAAGSGATRLTGTFETFDRAADGTAQVGYRNERDERVVLRARAVIGADGARSRVAQQTIRGGGETPCVFAYHEIVRSPVPAAAADFEGTRCDVVYRGEISPDFYETVRREGAPIPLKPLRKWDNDRDVVLAGDAAGVVAPASGEGIYYAMAGGRLAADAVQAFLATGEARALRQARARFMKAHGRVFWVLGLLQRFWYSSDRRRERFVKMCEDPDVQRLTWQSYMHKKLVRRDPLAHVRVFFKDVAHLLGLAKAH